MGQIAAVLRARLTGALAAGSAFALLAGAFAVAAFDIFEARTAKAMGKLGVPTAKDVAALTQRVDELSALVTKMSKASTTKAAPKAPAKAAEAEPVAKAPSKRARKTAETG